MYRLAYRNFGDHESLVVNHTVSAVVNSKTVAGIRWYELRNTPASATGTPSVFQQGTFAPDQEFRWMGSIAMSGAGDIALGYSRSSSNSGDYPSIAYTGRLAGDAAGKMTQGETVMIKGKGSQEFYNRWGDYSSMSVDPSDDCTFWYTNEYLASNGSFNWHTRIGSFKLAGCNTVPSNFSLSASPTSLSLAQGGSGTLTISTAVTSGSAQTVSLSASGQPAGTTVSFNPTSVTAGSSSTMTVSVGSSTAPGSYTITVTATGTSATHTITIGLICLMVGPNGTPILDNFNHADASTLGANWGAPLTAFFPSFHVSGNAALVDPTLGNSSNWWTTIVGPDCEVFATISTPATPNFGELYLRLVNPGITSITGYSLRWSSTSIFFVRWDNGTQTGLGDTIPFTPAAGNRLGFSIVGSTLTAYLNTGSGWVVIDTTTDSTYSAAGYLGMLVWNDTSHTLTLDDFGGGTVG
jgi:hypothetical protein